MRIYIYIYIYYIEYWENILCYYANCSTVGRIKYETYKILYNYWCKKKVCFYLFIIMHIAFRLCHWYINTNNKRNKNKANQTLTFARHGTATKVNVPRKPLNSKVLRSIELSSICHGKWVQFWWTINVFSRKSWWPCMQSLIGSLQFLSTSHQALKVHTTWKDTLHVIICI